MNKLYIDDIRDPKTDGWIIVRTSQEAIDYIENNGMVDYISFDHDLGGDDTSMVFIKWLIEKDLDEDIIPHTFSFNIHSANPVGTGNIKGMLDNYMNFKFRGKNVE